MHPLYFERQSAIPGEGSVFLVLSRRENPGKYGCIRGVSMGFADHGELDLPEEGLLILGGGRLQRNGNAVFKIHPRVGTGCLLYAVLWKLPYVAGL